MKILQVIQNIRHNSTLQTNKIKLGRWNRETYKKTELKLFYANEDHCGVCVKYGAENKNDSYYLPFTV